MGRGVPHRESHLAKSPRPPPRCCGLLEDPGRKGRQRPVWEGRPLQTLWAPREMKHLPSSRPKNTTAVSASSRHRTRCSQADPLPARAARRKFVSNFSLASPHYQDPFLPFNCLTYFFKVGFYLRAIDMEMLALQHEFILMYFNLY